MHHKSKPPHKIINVVPEPLFIFLLFALYFPSLTLFTLIGAGSSHEADEGAAGEEQDERVSQKPRDSFFEERPAQARGL